MIREAVRIVFKMDRERAVNSFHAHIEEWRNFEIEDVKKLLKTEFPFYIAEVIVALTNEEIGMEYTRCNALKNATKFVNEVKMTLHRKVGRHENLLITLSDGDIYDKELLKSTVDSLAKLVSSGNFTLEDFINKGSLIVASMMHIVGLSEIDVNSVGNMDAFLQ